MRPHAPSRATLSHHPPPLSSRGLGRRPLTAETRVRIPVAVLRSPRVHGGFRVFRGVRHSRIPRPVWRLILARRRLVAVVCGRRRFWDQRELRVGRLEIGIEAGRGRLFSARDEMAIAVPGLADVAVTGPGGDLLPVKAGGDEVADRAVASLVRRDRVQPRRPPRLVRAGADGGGEKRLVAVRPNTRSSPSRLVRCWWAWSSRRAANAIGTARCPAPVLTSTGPLTGSQERSTRTTPASKSTWSHCSPRSSPRRRPQNKAVAQNAFSLGGSAASSSCGFSRGSIRSRRPRIAGMSRSLVGSIAVSSRRMARRKITRSGSTMLLIVEGERPCARSSSAKSWMSRRWTADSLRGPSAGRM